MKCQEKKCKGKKNSKLGTLRTTYMGHQRLAREEMEHMIRVRSCPLCGRRYETVELFLPAYTEQVRSLEEQIRQADREKREFESANMRTLVSIDSFLNLSPIIADLKVAAGKIAAAEKKTRRPTAK